VSRGAVTLDTRHPYLKNKPSQCCRRVARHGKLEEKDTRDHGSQDIHFRENSTGHTLTHLLSHRADDKTAEEYALEGGATLHLVLALRGGSS
jgi:hypothetical protein